MNTLLPPHPQLSSLKPSSTLHINETVNQRWQRGENVFHMGFGESRFEVHPKIQRALRAHTHQKSYLPAQGLPALCDQVAQYYSHHLDASFKAEQVIIGPGSKALIYGLQMALESDLFLPSPSWVSYAPQATLLGLKHHYLPSSVEDDYRFDLEAFAALVGQSSNPNKLLVINSPNNPTGQVWDAGLLKEIAAYCRQHEIFVLSDEIYFRVLHEDAIHHSIVNEYPEGTFVLGGLSKHLSIGGWRLGVGLLPDTEMGCELMTRLRVISSETWSGVSAPIQYSAITAYENDADIEEYVAQCAQLHGVRTGYFREALVLLGVHCPRPHGAFYLMPNFNFIAEPLARAGVNTSADLAKYLLEHHALATLPGEDFGLPPETLSLRLATSYLDMEDADAAERIYALHQQGLSASELMSKAHHPNTHGAIDAFRAFASKFRQG